jgi:hypothetical protein
MALIAGFAHDAFTFWCAHAQAGLTQSVGCVVPVVAGRVVLFGNYGAVGAVGRCADLTVRGHANDGVGSNAIAFVIAFVIRCGEVSVVAGVLVVRVVTLRAIGCGCGNTLFRFAAIVGKTVDGDALAKSVGIARVCVGGIVAVVAGGHGLHGCDLAIHTVGFGCRDAALRNRTLKWRA